MTLIDQRILIDAPQEIVWDFVANPDRIARWHTGYTSVAVLTTQPMGTGARWRCTPSGGGKDMIEEITATVNGIGYEYVIIEGSPYLDFLARIRLQAGPDGTSVQWTIEYTPKGLIGRIKNRLGGQRQVETMMASSLRQLRHQVDAHGVRMDEEDRERVGMRDRLDFNERTQYQRRHAPPPGIDPVENVESPAELAEQALYVEAAEAEKAADLREAAHPAAPALDSTPSEPAPDVVPSFVTDLLHDEGEADYSHKADTKPRPPEGLREAIQEQAATPPAADQHTPASSAADPNIEPPPPAEIVPPPTVDPKRPTPPRGTPAVQPTPSSAEEASFENETSEPAQTGDHTSHRQAVPNARTVGEFAPVDHTINLPPQTPTTDTGEISIWDVFGVQRPSDEDSQTLDELVQTVRQREHTARVRQFLAHSLARPGTAHATRLRVRAHSSESAAGLRLYLALQAARVRLRKPFC